MAVKVKSGRRSLGPWALAWVALAAGALAWPASTHAARLELVVGGLSSPVYVTHGRDASGRLFIVEQRGVIKVLPPGASTPAVYLDIAGRVAAGGERGLLGLAFHPGFATNRRLFVNYTRQPDGATVVAEYQALPGLGDRADPASERVLLTVGQPFANHNGGMIEFGPDGFLYIALGDGGSAFDPGNRAQSPDDLLGKILRIDVDSGSPYGIPPGNPFAAGGGRAEVYALGLRNPFRFSFDRVTGTLFAGDVGQASREEIDVIRAGLNYGWRVFEGSQCTGLAACSPTGFEPPVTEYQTHAGGRCAVTGGYVYRGSAGTFASGTYVFGDLCSGEVFLDRATSVLMDTGLRIASFGEDGAGELYVVDLGGAVYRLGPDAPGGPPVPPTTTALAAAVLPASRSVQVGVPATAFGTIINMGPATGVACGPALGTGGLPASLAYQTTDPATNQLTGSPDTPVDIPAGASQSFVFAVTASAPLTAVELPIQFTCENAQPAPSHAGLNTLLFSASPGPVPDLVALAATIGGDGIVDMSPGANASAFAVAAVNAGSSGLITLSADTGGVELPLSLTVCATSAATGQCTTPEAPAVAEQIAAGATATFAVFVRSSADFPFDPSQGRIVVRFRDESGALRGSTSVAARRQ